MQQTIPALGADFYQGKTLRLIVGSAPGGGYDTYTRLIARHIGHHIPGEPATVVENMPGAGGLIAANFLYKRADPDGLTIAVFNNSNVVQKALGDPRVNISFDKLGWVGAPSVGAPVCMVMGFTGLKTLDDVLHTKKTLKMGANRAGSAGYDLPLILNETLGTKFEVIGGYKGTSKIRVALQSREVDGFCSQWESMRVTARSMLDAKGDQKLIPFVINEKWEDPEVKDSAVVQRRHQRSEEIRHLQSLGGSDGFSAPAFRAAENAGRSPGHPAQGLRRHFERHGAACRGQKIEADDHLRVGRAHCGAGS